MNSKYMCLYLLMAISFCTVTAPSTPETPKGTNGIDQPKGK